MADPGSAAQGEADDGQPRAGWLPLNGDPPVGEAAASGVVEAPPSELLPEHLQERARRREQQEVLWSGAKVDGRLHWSVRECYSKFGAQLRLALRHYYCVDALVAGAAQPDSPFGRLDGPLARAVVEAALPGHGALYDAVAEQPRERALREGPFRVCVRKRPLLKFESQAGEFDSVGINPQSNRVVAHDGRLHRSGRRLTMTHHHFYFDKVWPASATNDDVYHSVQPLLARVLAGKDATVLCYGQTGTGKTHTIMGVLERLAADLAGARVEVTFYEIHGKKCYDLLSQRGVVRLMAGASDTVHVRGARRVMLEGAQPEALMGVLQEALALRQVEVTERNPISSRSHAICELRVLAPPGDDDGGGGAVMRVVDLAGSERNYETHNMSAQQSRDSALINSSLMALKDCIRAYGTNERAKFRASSLTQVLRGCFAGEQHRTLIIATVSPTPTDLIHTVNTLSHVSHMAPQLAHLRSGVAVDLPLFSREAADAKPVAQWSHEEVVSWLGSADGGRFAHVALPPGLDGAGLMRLSTLRLSQLFEGTLRAARVAAEGSAWVETAAGAERTTTSATDTIGRALFNALRRESRRVAEADRLRRAGVNQLAEPVGA